MFFRHILRRSVTWHTLATIPYTGCPTAYLSPITCGLHFNITGKYREQVRNSEQRQPLPVFTAPLLSEGIGVDEMLIEIFNADNLATRSSIRAIGTVIVADKLAHFFNHLSSAGVKLQNVDRLNNERVEFMLSIVDDDIENIDSGLLLRLCEAMLSVGLTSGTCQALAAVINRLTFIMSRLPVSGMLDVLQMMQYAKLMPTHTIDRKAYAEACHCITASCSLITSCREVCQLFKLVTKSRGGELSGVTYTALELQALRCLSDRQVVVDIGDLTELAITLAVNTRRNVPLLLAIADHLTTHLQPAGPNIATTHLTAMLYAYARLNLFPHGLMHLVGQRLTEYIDTNSQLPTAASHGVASTSHGVEARDHDVEATDHIVEAKSDEHEAIISLASDGEWASEAVFETVLSTITSIGHLKWFCPNLLSAISKFTSEHLKEVSGVWSFLGTYMQTLSVLGYTGEEREATGWVVGEIMDMLEGDVGAAPPGMLLDIVWALTVLGRLTPSIASALITHTLADTDISRGAFMTPMHVSKLVQIYNYSLLTHGHSYLGPPLSPHPYTARLSVGGEQSTYTHDAMSCVQSIAPAPHSLMSPYTVVGGDEDSSHPVYHHFTPITTDVIEKQPNQVLISPDHGCLDGAFYVSQHSGRAVPVRDVTQENIGEHYKVAIQCLSYTQMTRSHGGERDPATVDPNIRPLGHACLDKHLAQLQGYRVLQLPYTEFSSFTTRLDKVKYISGKFEDIVNRNE